MSKPPITFSPAPRPLRPAWPYRVTRIDYAAVARGGVQALAPIELSADLKRRAVQSTSTTHEA